MQRNRGTGSQGLLGNAPLGFGNNQGFGTMSGFSSGSGGRGNNVASALSPRGFGNSNLPNNHPHHEYLTKRVPDFGRGGGGADFNNLSRGGSNTTNSFNANNQQQHQQQQRQPAQQRSNNSNMQGMGGMLPLQQQQQSQQQNQHLPMAQLAIGQAANPVLNSPQQMNQLFNTDRDSQLALVNSLLKGSLIPNAANNGLNLQQNANKMQSPNNNINLQPSMNMNAQGISIASLGGMAHPGINGMNHLGMTSSGMQGASNGLQGSIHGSGLQGGGVSNGIIGGHLNYQQNQFGGGAAASAAVVTSVNNNNPGIGGSNMAMTSPGGGGSGLSMLSVPKAHPQRMLGNMQGLLSNQQSLLGTPSLRNMDFLQHRGNNAGGLLGRNSNNSNNRGNNSHNSQHRGGNHGYGGSHMVGRGRGPPNRSITNRGRPERRIPHSHHSRHDSRDSRDSHEGRDGRARHSGGHDRRDNSTGIINKRDADSKNEYSEKRQVALPSGGGDSLRVLVSDGQEEYDPAEPTEDHGEAGSTSESLLLDNDLGSPEINPIVFHAGRKRPKSHSPVLRSHTTTGDLKVTVDEKGRSVQDGPPQPKRRESSGGDVKDVEDGKFTCYACSVDCKGIQHFETHMRSARHRMRMESICSLHVQKTDQQLARMRAEEHLRRIEGREKEDYCRICDKRFVGSFITHRRGQEHRRKKMAERPMCGQCRMTFHSPKAFVAHCKTESHKKNKEELRKQEQNSAHSREEENDDTESFPDSFEELVTLDATGIYKNDDHEEVISDNDSDSNFNYINDEDVGMSRDKLSSASLEHPENEGVESSPNAPREELDTEEVRDEEGEKSIADKEDKAASESPFNQASDVKEPLLPLPTFDPEVAVGQDHVVPIKGLFCKLCHKFYMSEEAAHSIHCRTRSHFDLYMEYQKALNSKRSKTIAVDAQTLSPAPALAHKVAPSETAKDSCQTIIIDNDVTTELAIDQSEQATPDEAKSEDATRMNGGLMNGSSKSDSLDEVFEECGDVSNDADDNDNILGDVTDNVVHEEDDINQGSLSDSPMGTPSLHSPALEVNSIVNDDVTNDNDIIMNGGDEEDDAVILHKDSNGEFTDDVDEGVDLVQVVEVQVGMIAPKRAPRVRRGRSRPNKHGRSK